ncbi:hypothetical protein EJB05_18788, partial [Eragrostis curvula]
MATDFFWSYTDEPHASRRREILAKYPQIKELFGPDPHNLAFTTPSLNRWLGIFANLPIGVPMSITFQKYHLEHHRFQGVDGIDMDIPSQAEAHVVKNTLSKCVWVMLQLFFYALRPLFLKPKPPGLWEFTNLSIQVALDAGLVYFYGWKSLGYLILSTFVGGGMHPMADHFISEHYVFSPEQETYSYYGPLNLMTSRGASSLRTRSRARDSSSSDGSDGNDNDYEAPDVVVYDPLADCN